MSSPGRSPLTKLIHDARHELRYGLPIAWGRFQGAVERRHKRQRLIASLDQLRANPPDVLIGANINRTEGIRNHLAGIQKHSALRTALSPPDNLLEYLEYPDFHTTFREHFLAFSPAAIRVIHSHVYPYFVEWCHLHRDSGTRWVHTYHSPYFPVPGSVSLLPWQEKINEAGVNLGRDADVRISVSRWQQRYLEEKFGIGTTYLPNGVDVTLCDEANAARFRELAGRGDFVLYVGRDEAVKNPADFARLAARFPELTFVMAGRGLTALTIESNFGAPAPPNLIFAGELSRIGVQDAIAGCSLLVVTSIWEGLPTLVLEAMVHEKPLVVPDNDGCVEAVDGGRFGFVYRQGDIDDLVQKCRAALSGNERRTGARERVLAEYDWRVVARRLDGIYAGADA